VSKPSPDKVAKTEFHSLELLMADGGIEYARRIGVSSDSPAFGQLACETKVDDRPFCSIQNAASSGCAQRFMTALSRQG
jgi:hypothetical protein